MGLRGRGWVWREAYLVRLLCTKLFSNELMGGQRQNEGQRSVKRVCAHTLALCNLCNTYLYLVTGT